MGPHSDHLHYFKYSISSFKTNVTSQASQRQAHDGKQQLGRKPKNCSENMEELKSIRVFKGGTLKSSGLEPVLMFFMITLGHQEKIQYQYSKLEKTFTYQ